MGIYTTLPQKRLKRAKMELIQGFYKKLCANTPNKNPIQDIKKHSLETSYFDVLGRFVGVNDKYTALHERAVKTQNKASV